MLRKENRTCKNALKQANKEISYVAMLYKYIYYIDTIVLLGNTPLLKFIRSHIWDSGGVFFTSPPVKISITSLMSCFSFKLSLNLLVYDQNIFGFSSKVLSNLRLSSEIF